MLICVGSPVESLNIFAVYIDGRTCILDNFLPVPECIVAGGSIGIENGVWLAYYGFPVQIYGIIVIPISVSLVASELELASNIYLLLIM